MTWYELSVIVASGIRNVVKLCVGPIDLIILALCFLSARNDIDLKYKEFCRLLRRSDSNSRPNVRHITGVPDHRVSKKQTNERVNNVRTVTCQAYTQTRAFGLRRGHSRSRTYTK